jgi:O-antigen ligase
MTTGATRRRRLLSAATAALIVAAVTGLFALAVRLGSPVIAPLAMIAIGAPVLMIRYPWTAVAVLVGAEACNISTVAGRHGSLILYALMATAGVAILVGLRRGTIRLAWSPVFLFAALYLGTRALSLLVATDLGAGLAAVAESAKLLVYLVVVTILIAGTGRSASVAKVLVLVIAFLAGLSVIQEFVFHNSTTFWGLSQVPFNVDLGGATPRHSGPYTAADVVGWGKVQVTFLPLAMSLLAYRAKGPSRWVWGAATAAILGGIYLTQSRGAYVALALAVAVWLVAAGRGYLRLLKFAPAALLILALVPGVGSRLATLVLLGEASRGGGVDQSLVERAALQRDAFAMIDQHPGLGVGAGNFLVVQPEYQRDSGRAATSSIPVHNSYLLVAAEGGVLGLAAWLLFYGCAAFVTLRSLIIFRRLGARGPPGPGGTLAVGVLAGLAGFALATLFVPLTQVRTLMSVVALGAALDITARRAAAAAGPQERHDAQRSATAARPWRRILRSPALHGSAVFITLLVVGSVALPLRQSVWGADATAQVVPRTGDRSLANAYEYDLLSRGTLVPTYAGIVSDRLRAGTGAGPDAAELRHHDVQLTVSAVPSAALITVSAAGPRRAVAVRTAHESLDRARAYVASINDLYVLVPVPGPDAVVRADGGFRTGPVSALLVTSAAVAAVVYGVVRRRNGPRRLPHQTRDRRDFVAVTAGREAEPVIAWSAGPVHAAGTDGGRAVGAGTTARIYRSGRL